MKKNRLLISAGTVLALLVLAAVPAFSESTDSGAFKKDTEIEISFGLPVDEAWAKDPGNYRVVEKPDPDIALSVEAVTLDPRRVSAVLKFKTPLNTGSEYVVEAKNVTSEGKSLGNREFVVKKAQAQILFSLLLGAMLINNFVFTKYLGLCIFFGVSQKKDTAIGMGMTFTVVMVLSGVMCWALFSYVLQTLHLDFLKIIVFIGMVAIFVQAMDTILRKVNPYLFKKLGVYLVLITTNCIILAVPLENATGSRGPSASLTYALGAGLGFALALFLMSCVREKLEVCNVPPVFRGLPIAFIVTGLFALAFLGFSGLVIF